MFTAKTREDWYKRISRYLRLIIEKPGLASWRPELHEGRTVIGVTVDKKEIHLDFYRLADLASVPKAKRPDPSGLYFEMNKDGTFQRSHSAFELIHQGALEGSFGRISRPLSWWESRRFRYIH